MRSEIPNYSSKAILEMDTSHQRAPSCSRLLETQCSPKISLRVSLWKEITSSKHRGGEEKTSPQKFSTSGMELTRPNQSLGSLILDLTNFLLTNTPKTLLDIHTMENIIQATNHPT